MRDARYGGPLGTEWCCDHNQEDRHRPTEVISEAAYPMQKTDPANAPGRAACCDSNHRIDHFYTHY
jgi:hypothetical protein